MFNRPRDRVRLVPMATTSPEATFSYYTRPFHCIFCPGSKNFESDTEVEEHKVKDHRKAIQRLVAKSANVCKMCVKKTESKASLLKHFKVNHLYCNSDETRINREVYVCDICHRLYFSKLMLTHHLIHVHKYRTQHVQCPKCEKKILYRSSYLHFHGHCMQTVSACPICFIKFDRKKEVLKHVQSHHPCSYKCNVCHYETKKHENLVFHMAKMHEQTTIVPDKNLRAMAARCFLNATADSDGAKLFNYSAPLATRGVTLSGVTNLCILCREICTDESEMLQHYTAVHATTQTKSKKKYICACGEEFFNNVLLKHHVFKLKEPHRMLKEGELIEVELEPLEEKDDGVEVFVEWLSESEQVGRDEVVGDEIKLGGDEVGRDEVGSDEVGSDEVGRDEVISDEGEGEGVEVKLEADGDVKEVVHGDGDC